MVNHTKKMFWGLLVVTILLWVRVVGRSIALDYAAQFDKIGYVFVRNLCIRWIEV